MNQSLPYRVPFLATYVSSGAYVCGPAVSWCPWSHRGCHCTTQPPEGKQPFCLEHLPSYPPSDSSASSSNVLATDESQTRHVNQVRHIRIQSVIPTYMELYKLFHVSAGDTDVSFTIHEAMCLGVTYFLVCL